MPAALLKSRWTTHKGLRSSIFPQMSAALTRANGDIIELSGFTSNGDGCGARYIHFLTGRAGVTIDGVINVSGAGTDDYFKLVKLEVIDLADHGILPTESQTNNTTRFQAVLDAVRTNGAILRTPLGVVNINGMLTVNGSNLVLEGQGVGGSDGGGSWFASSQIRQVDVTLPLIRFIPDSGTKGNLCLERLKLTSPRSTTNAAQVGVVELIPNTAPATTDDFHPHLSFERVEVEGGYHCIWFKAGNRGLAGFGMVAFSDCYAHDAEKWGMMINCTLNVVSFSGRNTFRQNTRFTYNATRPVGSAPVSLADPALGGGICLDPAFSAISAVWNADVIDVEGNIQGMLLKNLHSAEIKLYAELNTGNAIALQNCDAVRVKAFHSEVSDTANGFHYRNAAYMQDCRNCKLESDNILYAFAGTGANTTWIRSKAQTYFTDLVDCELPDDATPKLTDNINSDQWTVNHYSASFCRWFPREGSLALRDTNGVPDPATGYTREFNIPNELPGGGPFNELSKVRVVGAYAANQAVNIGSGLALYPNIHFTPGSYICHAGWFRHPSAAPVRFKYEMLEGRNGAARTTKRLINPSNRWCEDDKWWQTVAIRKITSADMVDTYSVQGKLFADAVGMEVAFTQVGVSVTNHYPRNLGGGYQTTQQTCWPLDEGAPGNAWGAKRWMGLATPNTGLWYIGETVELSEAGGTGGNQWGAKCVTAGINAASVWRSLNYAGAGGSSILEVTLTANSATPSVSGATTAKTANTANTIITNFTGGAAGQSFILLIRDAFTAINANATIVLKGPAIPLGSSGTTLEFAYLSGVWEETSRQVASGGVLEVTLATNSATPSVTGATVAKTANTANTTITNLTGGVPGQTVVLSIRDNFTSLSSNANIVLTNSNIPLNSLGVNIELVFVSSAWREVSRTVPATGGNFLEVTFADGDTTPSVLNATNAKTANTADTTITDFDDGVLGQHFVLHINDNFTRVVNNTDIELVNSLEIPLGSNGREILFTWSAGMWREVAPRVPLNAVSRDAANTDTIVAADNGNQIVIPQTTGTCVLTIPLKGAAPNNFDANATVEIYLKGGVVPSFTLAGGVTLDGSNDVKIAASKYSIITLRMVEDNVWVIAGDRAKIHRFVAKNADHTLSVLDSDIAGPTLVEATKATDMAITLPNATTDGIPFGTAWAYQQSGAGNLVFSGAGITIESEGNKFKTSAQHSMVYLICKNATTYKLTGDRKV